MELDSSMLKPFESEEVEDEGDEDEELVHEEIEHTIDQLRLYELISELKELLNRNISKSSSENTYLRFIYK
jgi:hypothetical protein